MPWWNDRPNYEPVATQQKPAPQADAMKLDIYHHVSAPDLSGILARLDRLQVLVTGLLHQGNRQMATTQELLATVQGVVAAVAPLPAAIDALEAALAAALANVGGIPAEDQANIDAAFAALKDVPAAVNAAVADATDGPAT
jgi:uncharacterized protein YoxC